MKPTSSRLKWYGQFEAGAGFPDEYQGVVGEELPFFKVNALGKAAADGTLTLPEDTISVETARALRAFVFPPGTIAFAKIGAALLLGRLRTLASRACLDNNMMGFVVRPPNNVGYFRYAMSLVPFDLIANPGTVPSLNQGQIANFALPIPPPSLQQAIAAFLDRETGKIDALVEEQWQLIELLKEKRQAVISHAVTKGLDPNAKMKPSGVEWLGDVPEHWEVTRMRYLGEAIIGLTYAPEDVVDEGEGILVLRSSNVQAGRIALEDNVYVSVSPPERLVTQLGDILICARNGSRALIGKNAMIGGPSVGMTFGAFMTIFRGPYNDHLRWVLRSSLFDAQAGAYMSTTINQLTTSTLNGMDVPLPPEGERATISAYLEATVGRYDSLIGEAEAAIALLSERRSAIISAAVTGKIDVRQHAEADTAAA